MSREPFEKREPRMERPPTLNTDPFGEGGRMYNRALGSELSDTVSVYGLILKALIFPFWLPFWLMKRFRTRKEMLAAGREWREAGLPYREMAVKWAERFPSEYPLGEYDPRVKGLETRFRKLLDESRVRV